MATTRTRADAPAIANWDTNQSVGPSDFTTVWSTGTDGNPREFHRAIFQTNSSKMYLRVLINGETKLDVDLEEVENDYKLKFGGNVSCVPFAISLYAEPSLWLYSPVSSLLIGSGEEMLVQVKSKSGNKKVVRGMSEWGVV